jgi:hypothetical protein
VQKEPTKIHLDLNQQEVNTIIEALGHLPFMKVYKLIEKIHIKSKRGDT